MNTHNIYYYGEIRKLFILIIRLGDSNEYTQDSFRDKITKFTINYPLILAFMAIKENYLGTSVFELLRFHCISM